MKNFVKIIIALGKKYGQNSPEQMRAWVCETQEQLDNYAEIFLGSNFVKNLSK